MTENKTILYVEDNQNIRALMMQILKDEAKEVFQASNGIEALEVFQTKKPDIIITDITMPKMNGLDMLKKIYQVNPYQNIIILSALNKPELELNNLGNKNKIHFLNKPLVDDEKLFEILDSFN